MRRPVRQWPAWVDDVLAFAPIAELEAEWRAGIGDAITRVLDLRNGLVQIACPCCGTTRPAPVDVEPLANWRYSDEYIGNVVRAKGSGP